MSLSYSGYVVFIESNNDILMDGAVAFLSTLARFSPRTNSWWILWRRHVASPAHRSEYSMIPRYWAMRDTSEDILFKYLDSEKLEMYKSPRCCRIRTPLFIVSKGILTLKLWQKCSAFWPDVCKNFQMSRELSIAFKFHHDEIFEDKLG